MPIPFYIYLFILVFAPLAFGSVEYWSLGLIEALVPVALLLLNARLLRKKELFVQVPGLLPLILLICWMGLQLVPLPPGLVQTIAPKIHQTYQPLLELSEQQPWIPLTVQPKATLQEFLRFSTYALFFVLTIQLLSRRDRLQKTVSVVAWLGVAIAVEAIIQKLTSPDAIYWFRAVPQSASRPIGPWVYSNHFAGFMEMLFTIVLALFIFYKPKVSYNEPLRDRVIALFTMPGTNKHLLFGTGAILMAVSILLSISRGGIITLCFALLLFIVFSAGKRGKWQNKWAAFITIVVLLMISWLGWDPIMERFGAIWGENGLDTNGRLPVLLDTRNMIHDFLITGSGFGTFEAVFPSYRTSTGEGVIFDHAHNDYAELLSTGGLIGFLLASWFVATIIIHVVQAISRRRERYNVLLTSGSLTGMVALLLHCLVDFQMYNGANGLYFFFLCGLSISGANTRLRYRTRPSLLSRAKRFQVPLVSVLTITILVCGLWYNSASYHARHNFAPIRDLYLNRNIPESQLQAMYGRSQKAASLDILEGYYLFTMGNISSFLGLPVRAEKEYLQASFLNPMSGRFIQQLALSLNQLQADTTENLLALGYTYEPLIFERLINYLNYLAASDKRKKAFTTVNQTLQNKPHWISRLGGFVFFNELSREEIEAMLPPYPEIWHKMGLIMETEGKEDEAAHYYQQALQLLTDHEPKPQYFSRLYRMYLRQEDNSKALTILRKGIEYLPDNATFHKQLGDYYRKQDITYRAIEEYRQALQLAPGDVRLKQKLNDLQRIVDKE